MNDGTCYDGVHVRGVMVCKGRRRVRREMLLTCLDALRERNIASVSRFSLTLQCRLSKRYCIGESQFQIQDTLAELLGMLLRKYRECNVKAEKLCFFTVHFLFVLAQF